MWPRVAAVQERGAQLAQAINRPGEQIADDWFRSRIALECVQKRWMAAVVEPGRNLELDETIRLTLRLREHIVMWGPYEIQPQLYRRFLLQKAHMESGRVGYQTIDTVGTGADGSGCDCIHAITDMDPEFDRGYYPLIRYGVSASRFVVRQVFERNLLISEDTHSWLETPLGLCDYPIARRVYRARPHLPQLFGRMGS